MRLLYRSSDPTAAREVSQEDLVELYRHRLPQGRHNVWLRSNFVTSLDGSIQGGDGRSRSLNTPSDHHVFALHRAHADVVLVGAQTARAEGYRAVDLAPWQRRIRSAAGLSEIPMLAIVTRSLDLDPAIAAHGSKPVGPVTVFTTTGKSAKELSPFSAAGIEVVQLGEDTVDLNAVTDQLAEAGCPRVLCEGGSRLHRDLISADLLDETSLTLAPVMVAGDGRRTTVGAFLAGSPSFELTSALYADDGTVFLNYDRSRA